MNEIESETVTLLPTKYTKTLDKWAFIVYFTCNGVDEDSIIFPKDKANRGW